MFSKDATSKIAKISTGHTKDDGLIGADLFPGPCIIDGLGEDAGNIDRICSTQGSLLINFLINKSFLYHVLTIIKITLYFQGSYIASIGG